MTDRQGSSEKLYDERDVVEQGEYYTRHVQALTAEGLHAKSDIAAELAQRDIEIDQLRAELDYAYRCITGGYRQGVFDFSVLKERAFDFTGLERPK